MIAEYLYYNGAHIHASTVYIYQNDNYNAMDVYADTHMYRTTGSILGLVHQSSDP